MVRTQLYIDVALHRRLKAAAAKQGRTVSDLVREAVARVFGGSDSTELSATLNAITGLWQDRKDLGDTHAYVRRLRRDTRRRRRKG